MPKIRFNYENSKKLTLGRGEIWQFRQRFRAKKKKTESRMTSQGCPAPKNLPEKMQSAQTKTQEAQVPN